MLRAEIKKIILALGLFSFVFFILPSIGLATDYSSGSFTVKDPVIDQGAVSSASLNFGLGQSFGQLAIGKSSSASFQLWSGFQYFFTVQANVLTATPGDTEVDLNWTVPQSFLGVTISSYEVGTGTTSGSYVFQNVGNTTSYTKTGLTNSVPYYFIIKALGPGGTFLVFSNEATATPIGSVTPPPGGGGSGSYPAVISFSGIAYPSAIVNLLRDSSIVASTTAGADGGFTFNQSLGSGNYNFSIYAIDVTGTQSASVSFFETLSNSVTTIRSGIILPPTLSTSHTAIKQGETLTLSGYSAPNAAVTTTLTGAQNLTLNVSAGANGFYKYEINTATIKKGDYSAVSVAKVGSVTTASSLKVTFNVGDKTITPPTDCGKRSDLNCDSRVDLIDFSILLYYWDETEFSRNPRVDIDKSGRVGLRDFSIMLYDWTG